MNISSDRGNSVQPALQNEKIMLSTVIPNLYSVHSPSTMEEMDTDTK